MEINILYLLKLFGKLNVYVCNFHTQLKENVSVNELLTKEN